MDLPTPPSQQAQTTRTRDVALRRLAHVNRWLIAGSAALTGAFTAVAAGAFPGRTAKPATANLATRTSNAKRARTHHASSALKPPTTAPRSSEASTGSETSTGSYSASTSGEAPAQAASSTGETGSAQEAASARESASSSESATTRESTPESTSTPETAALPAQESTPVTSGGS